MSTNNKNKNNTQWICESLTSKQYGFKPFKTSMKRECFVCGFKDYLRVHHIIPLSKSGDHCEENVVPLCLNHHRMAHDKKQNLKLPKGKVRDYTTKEIEAEKEREKALIEGLDKIFQLSEVKDAETRAELIRNLGYLFEKYQIDYIDCISYQLGIKRESLLKNYIFKDVR